MEKKDPFDFLFYYEFDTGERKENALLVGNNPSTASPLHLAIGIKEAAQIIIHPLLGVTTASSSDYHFKLQFNPGILLETGQITVDSNDWDLKVEGDTILYLLWKGEEVTLTEDNSIEIILNGVMATLTPAMPKTTTTNVTLSWDLDRPGIRISEIISRRPDPEDPNPYNTNFTETLEMIQREGPAIPLYVGFFSSNRVLNTNNQESKLKLRITNMSDSPITFKYDSDATNRSQLVVALEVGTVSAAPWALGTQDQVNDVVVSIDDNKWQSSAARPTLNDGMLEWTFSPKSADLKLDRKETLVINLSKIVTAHPTGMTNLYLRSQYVPGYQDGEFICQIEKAPLVFPETKVGIGTTTPTAKLQINGKETETTFLSDNGTAKPVIIKDGNVGIGTDNPTAKLHVASGNAIITGNVGIGTTSPSAKLHVDSGNVIISGNVGIGTTSPQAKLQINDGGIKLGTDGQGIEFYDGAKIYQASGKGLKIKPHNDNQGIEFLNTAGTGSQMIIKNDKVGIGTTVPSQTLDVSGGIKVKSISIDNEYAGSSNNTLLQMRAPGNLVVAAQISETYVPSRYIEWKIKFTSSKLQVYLDDRELRSVSFSNSGKIGIGFTTDELPKAKLDVRGDVYIGGNLHVTGNLNYRAWLQNQKHVADQQLQKDIKPLSNALEKITSLRGVSYKWNEEGLAKKAKDVEETIRSESGTEEDNQKIWAQEKQRIYEANSGEYKGFIAQELENIFPEWVSTDEDGHQTINISEFLPVIVEAIKELRSENESLRQHCQEIEQNFKAHFGSV